MRQSNLAAAAFAVVIAALLSFAAGYFVGKGDTPAATPPSPVATLDQPPTPEPAPATGPLTSEVSRPDATNDNEATTPEVPTPTVDNELPQPAPDATNPQPKDPTPEAEPAIEPRGLPVRIDMTDPFAGPKVEVAAQISGRVVDSQGVPIAGAAVYAQFGEGFESSTGGQRVMIGMAGNSAAEDIARTDVDGRFSAAVTRSVREGNSLRLTLTARHDDFARSEEVSVTLRHGDSKQDIELRLRGTGDVSGRVVDEFGNGVEGVTVSLVQPRGAGGGFTVVVAGQLGEFRATTDGAGEYLIQKAPEGRHSFGLHGAGFVQISGPTQVDVTPGQQTRAAADFVVKRTASLELRLQDEFGLPLDGWVTLKLADQEGRVVQTYQGLSTDGLFQANNPPAGSFEVTIEVRGYFPVKQAVDVVEGGRSDLGRVTLQELEAPHPGGRD